MPNPETVESLGRAYYDQLIEGAIERHWVVPISVHVGFTDKSFDCKRQDDSLANLVFGKPFVIKDIYLFSKLSDDNKVRIDLLAPDEDPETRFSRKSVPIGIMDPAKPFGAFRDDLFTTLLAQTKVKLEAERQEVGALISGMYKFDIGSTVFGIAGVSIPIKSVLHILDVKFIGGELFREGFVADTTQRENTLKQFHREFIDLCDFFERGILEPKGLKFCRRQRETGIGDVTLWGLVDFERYFEHVSALQTGITLVFPSGGKPDPNIVWEPVLGNGGAFQVDIFAHALFNCHSSVINPSARVIVEVSAPFTNFRRVPKLKCNDKRQMVKKVEGLLAPEAFQEYHVDPFEEFDVGILHFADQAICLRTRFGTKVIVGLGNYFEDIFRLGLRLGVFYNFMHKTEDSFDCDAGLDTKLLEFRTDAQSHTISWNLAYEFRNMFELQIGSDHIVAGKNVAKHKEVFITLAIVF